MGMVGFDLDVRMLLRSSEDDILFWGEGAYAWLGFEEG